MWETRSKINMYESMKQIRILIKFKMRIVLKSISFRLKIFMQEVHIKAENLKKIEKRKP